MRISLRSSIFFSILIFFIGKELYSQEFQDWKYTHPTPQANHLRNIQMIDENTWIAVGANGTFMKTTNGGETWYFHHQAGVYSDAAKTIGGNYNLWFFDANNGYVTGMTGYIGKTTDGGVTFNQVGAGVIPTNEWGQGIWFANQDTGFVSTRISSWTTGRIVRTTNGGETWTTVLTYSEGITAVYGTDSKTIYAVAVDGTIFKTTDCGQNWTPNTSAVGQYMYGMSFLDQNIGFVIGSGGGLSRTTNAGSTWVPLTTPQVDWSYYQIKVVSASEIYAVGDPSFLYKSTDLGNTWQTISVFPVNGPASTYIWYSLGKVGQTMILSGDFGVVAKSIDNGASWSSRHYSLNTNIILDMDRIPGTNNLIAVGRQYELGTRQLYFSSDFGTFWSTRDLGVDMNASAICMVNSQIGYISGTNCQVLKTTNGGTNWFQVAQPYTGTLDIFSLDFINPDTGWAFINYSTASGGNAFKTTDGGNSWTQQAGNIPYSISSADMVDANIGYITINSSNRPIYKTTDGGTNWSSVTTPLTGIIKTVKSFDANTLYIGSSSGTTRMAKSTDGGTTWTSVTLPVSVDINSFDFVDVNHGYVSGNTTTVVCKTTDGGITWSFQNLHINTLTKVVALQNDLAFAFGTFGSIFRYDPNGVIPVEMVSFSSNVSGNNVSLKWSTATELNNSGFEIERSSESSTWEKIGFVAGSGSSSEYRFYNYEDNKLNPGIYYYRLKQLDYDGTFEYSNEIQVEVATLFDFALEQNYPNPFNPNTNIRFSVPQNSLVNIKVYNIVGQEVEELINENKSAGKYDITFNSKGLASGIYLVKMQAGEFTSSMKMTLLK